MALTFTTPRVSKRTRYNRDTREVETYWEVCVTLSNDGDKDVDTCVTLYQQDRDTNPNTPAGAIVATECTEDVTVPKKRVIRDGAGNVVIEMDGSKVICCELDGEPLDGQEYVAVGGTTKDKDGDVKSGGSGNFYSPTGTYNRPKRVSMRPGEKRQYAALMGVGFPGIGEALINGALELPEGWEIDFPEVLKPGPYPVEVAFTLQAAQRVKAGTAARVTLRAFDTSSENSGAEETTIEFMVEGDQALPGACPCCNK